MACSACKRRREAIRSTMRSAIDAARRVIVSTPGQRPTGIVKNSVKRDNRR